MQRLFLSVFWVVMVCALVVWPMRALAEDKADGSKADTTTDPAANPTSNSPDDAAAKPSAERDDLVVISATKSRRHADLTPGEVSVETREEIMNRQSRDLQDILRYMPGVEVFDQTRGVGQKPIIRGLSDERVLVSVDGTRLTFDSGHKGQIFIDPAWLRRVEVLRGASSALYGSNAIGGVLAMQTIMPADLLGSESLFAVRQQFGYQGNNNEFSTITTLAGRLAREGNGRNIEYLFGYARRDAFDNYHTGDREIPYSEEDIHNGIAKLVWWLTDTDRLEVSHISYFLDGMTPTNTESFAPGTESPLVDRQTYQQLWRMAYEHDDPDNPWVNLSVVAYFNDLSIKEEQPGVRKDDIDFDTTGFEIRNATRLGSGKHHARLTYGFEYYRDSQKSKRNGGPNTLFPNADADNYGVYLQAEISLWNDLLTIIPGVRGDWYSLEASGKTGVEESALSPKVGVLLKLDDELKLRDGDFVVLHGSYGQGFRTPSFGELFIAGPHFTIPGLGTATFIANPDLKPETSWTAEGGIRGKFGPARAGVTYFQTQARDFIEVVQTTFSPFPGSPVGIYQPQNISEARLHGIEANAEYLISENVRLWGNFTHVIGDNETSGQPLSNISPDNVKLGVDVTLRDLGLMLGVRSRIYDKQDRVPTGGFVSDGFVLFDFVSSWTPAGPGMPKWMEGLEVGFAVENLTDEEFSWFTGSPGHGINPAVTISYTKRW